MKVTLTNLPPEKTNSSCLVIPLLTSEKQFPITNKVDEISDRYIHDLIKIKDLQGRVGNTYLLHDLPNIATERVMLVGCGTGTLNILEYKKICTSIFEVLKSSGVKDILINFNSIVLEEDKQEINASYKLRFLLTAMHESYYEFNDYKSSADNKEVNKIANLSYYVADKDLNDIYAEQITIGLSLDSALTSTKDLANAPPNICTPTYLEVFCNSLAKKYKSLKTYSLGRKELEAHKMGAFLSVTAGTEQEPKLISLSYTGCKKTSAPIVLVGKGITFDTGGNSLKPPLAMRGMKYDMCGAASVIGIMEFLAHAKLEINVIALVAAAENMPGAKASRPDDIITTMSGKTVEILNTDAEGRLVLCDTLTYAKKYKPKYIVDLATLTGACVVALGHHRSALYSNNLELSQKLLKAGDASFDKAWQMPLDTEYTKQLESKFADLQNVAGSDAGSVTAACFLAEFCKEYKWAHMDIAGTAAHFTGAERGATGRPLHLLAEFLINEAEGSKNY